MSQTSRTRILERLRRSSPAPVQPVSEHAGPLAAPVIDQFIHCLEQAHAEVVTTSRHRWRQDLTQLASQRGWRRWAVGDDDTGQAWREAAPQSLQVEAFASAFEEAHYHRLFESVDASLTGCVTAVAETGTLLLSSDRVPRTLSLVPPVHVVVVERGQIEADLPAALNRVKGRFSRLPTNLIWISGPSKTADIQQTLAYGAHGPKQLLVLLCDTQ